jgi:predicted component of type VI protein secretion system
MDLERMAKLRITSGPDEGKELSLSDTQVIGRLPTNAIPIKDSGSSRQNTRLYRAQGRFSLIDLNSKNGTYVNNEQVQRAELKDGDEIRIGSTTFRFVAEPSDAIDPAAAARAGRGPKPLTGSPDEVIQFEGARSVSEKALRFSRQTTGTGALRWIRSDFGQHSFLFRSLMLLGGLLLVSGVAVIVYRFAAGE